MSVTRLSPAAIAALTFVAGQDVGFASRGKIRSVIAEAQKGRRRGIANTFNALVRRGLLAYDPGVTGFGWYRITDLGREALKHHADVAQMAGAR